MSELDVVKSEITKAMTEIKYLPDMPAPKNSPKSLAKLPWTEVATLGTAFQPLCSMAQSISKPGGSGLYFVDTHGKSMFNYKNTFKFLGSLKNENGGVGGGQATLTSIPCDPTMLCMAAVLASVDKKLDQIKEVQEEIIAFLIQKEKSELRGDISFLSDVIENYKFNWDNEKYKSANHIKVLDIKQTSERRINFYREQISAKTSKQAFLHSDQDVKKMLSKVDSDFREYQLSLYLFAFSSFLEVVLLENYEERYLNSIKNKIEDYSLSYRELYTESYDRIKSYSETSVQSQLLGGLVTANTAVKKALSKIQKLNKPKIEETTVKLEETLDGVGTKIENFNLHKTEKAMISLSEKQDSYVLPFVESISTINTLYNQQLDIYFNDNSLYILQTE